MESVSELIQKGKKLRLYKKAEINISDIFIMFTTAETSSLWTEKFKDQIGRERPEKRADAAYIV